MLLDIRVFKSASWDATNQQLTINFSPSNEGKIDAGVPCLIRWGEPDNAPGGTIENPSFTNVAVDLWNQEVFDEDENEDEADQYETESNGLRFQALIAPVQLSANANALMLGDDNKLYKPSKSIYVYASRAYFTFSQKIALTRSIVMNFGDGDEETTYIDDIMVDDNFGSDADSQDSRVKGIFNLYGQRLDAPRKGLNIINGKKVFIK